MNLQSYPATPISMVSGVSPFSNTNVHTSQFQSSREIWQLQLTCSKVAQVIKALPGDESYLGFIWYKYDNTQDFRGENKVLLQKIHKKMRGLNVSFTRRFCYCLAFASLLMLFPLSMMLQPSCTDNIFCLVIRVKSNILSLEQH